MKTGCGTLTERLLGTHLGAFLARRAEPEAKREA